MKTLSVDDKIKAMDTLFSNLNSMVRHHVTQIVALSNANDHAGMGQA